MNKDKSAQEAIEDTGKKAPIAPEGPPAGPHAKQHLMDKSKTPGTGFSPDVEDESVSPAGG